MAGNVWERTSTKWVGNYENYRPDDSLEGDASRTVRGGSFFLMSGSCAAPAATTSPIRRQCGVSRGVPRLLIF
ncbi:MAG: hypothetical protein H6640_08420 [Caldilineaceae bacterium]|nr:hypothetical protein [Caldilineaceae bacterium]